jgi:HAD superfamily hydrolase (TIGR01457 family)
MNAAPDALASGWILTIFSLCAAKGYNFLMNGNEKLCTVRGFLLDMDGTFYLGDRLLEGALPFINVLRKQKKGFLFLTNNSSKHRRQYAEKISSLGLPIAEELVLTSGEATALYLREQQPGADLFLVGTPSLEDEFRIHGFRLVQQEPQFLVLGFDTTLTYQKLWKLCDFVRAGVPYIATHPDFNCPTEKGFMPDVGAMIAFVKASTGREPDLVVGKPNRLIVDAAALKMNLQVSQLAMIGDRLYTDIALGRSSGITTVLVLSGETKLEDLEDSPFQPDYIFQNLADMVDWLEENC